ELYNLYRKHRPLPPDTALDMHPVDNSVQMGELGATVPLTGVLQARSVGFQILPERLAPISAMRGRNVILIGDPQDSAAAAAVLERTPLTIDYDPATQDLIIRDRRQRGDEERAYIPKRGADKRYTDT